MKILIMAIVLAFASPSLAASTKTWKYNKSGKYWTVKNKKLKTTLERVDELKDRKSVV